MNRLALAISALLCAPLPGYAAAQDQQTCASRTEIVAKLNQQFKENQEAVGIVNDQAVMELFVSSEGTWTIIASGTDGMSCIVSAGTDWDGPDFIKGFDTRLRRPAAVAVPDRAN